MLRLSSSSEKEKDEIGFIYVLSNESEPYRYKIGMTRESSVEKRIKGYQTGASNKFVIEYQLHTSEPYKKEQIVHKILDLYRCKGGGGKEWFENIDLGKIIYVISQVDLLCNIAANPLPFGSAPMHIDED